MVHADFVIAEVDRITVVVGIHWRGLADLEAEERALLHGAFVEKQVVPVQIDGNVVGILGGADPGDVIDVCVGQQDRLHLDLEIPDRTHQLVHLVAGVDDDRFARTFAPDDEAVLVERRDGPHFKKHLG